MIRFGPVLLLLAVTIFCLIDVATTPSQHVRNLPKWAWLVIIVLFDLLGSVAWLVAGHPWDKTEQRQVPWPATRTSGFPEHERPRRTLAPDDDPEFLRQLGRSNRAHEDMLRRWEDDLRRREREQREQRGPDDGADGEPPADRPGAPTG